MELFRLDNTTGYSAHAMARLNAEWEDIVSSLGIDRENDEYDVQAKQFCDEVSRR